MQRAYHLNVSFIVVMNDGTSSVILLEVTPSVFILVVRNVFLEKILFLDI